MNRGDPRMRLLGGAAFRAAHLVRLAESPARTLPVALNSFTHDLPASPR